MKLASRRWLWLGSLLALPGVAAVAVYIATSVPLSQAREDPFARFTPSEENARFALEAALRSWMSGNPSGKVAGFKSPEIVLIDNCRRPGQTLERFTILGEAAGEGPRCLAVRVYLRNPDEEQRLRFVVYGLDPLLVYRYEDFVMMSRWECGRDERENKAASKRTSE